VLPQETGTIGLGWGITGSIRRKIPIGAQQ
jgi:hypothetical protein